MLNARTRLVAALVPAVVTFAVIALALYNFRALQRAVEWVDHTRMVIDRSDVLLARAVDAETGQRGYLVTGDSGFLAPGQSARSDVQQALADVRRLTTDNPRQQARLDTLEREIATRFVMLDSAIALRRTGQTAPLAKGDLLRAGRQRMDHARALIGAVKGEETGLLGQRRAIADEKLRVATLVLLLGGLLSVITAVVVNVMLARTITEGEQMSRELGAQLEDLIAAKRELAARATPPLSP
jgi:Predicted periplasmic ligand-binding sensor domain